MKRFGDPPVSIKPSRLPRNRRSRRKWIRWNPPEWNRPLKLFILRADSQLIMSKRIWKWTIKTVRKPHVLTCILLFPCHICCHKHGQFPSYTRACIPMYISCFRNRHCEQPAHSRHLGTKHSEPLQWAMQYIIRNIYRLCCAQLIGPGRLKL